MKKYIPNFLTCCNLFSGCLAAVAAFGGDYDGVLFYVVLSAVFDFFDGMAARALNVHSPIGKDLDSLADDVSFGLAPAVAVFTLMRSCLPDVSVGWGRILPYAAFLLAVFAALRLAKFNIDTRQKSSFIGLPVPANALFWASLLQSGFFVHGFFSPLWAMGVLLLLIVAFSYLMVSEIPMFSLKFKSLSWHDNAVPYSFLIGCVLILLGMGLSGLALCIVWYLLLSFGLAWRGVRKARANR